MRERVRLRVKVKSVLTYEGLKWPSEHGLFTKSGVEWLQSLNIDSISLTLEFSNVWMKKSDFFLRSFVRLLRMMKMLSC